jgi:hypothetical protein
MGRYVSSSICDSPQSLMSSTDVPSRSGSNNNLVKTAQDASATNGMPIPMERHVIAVD